MLLYSRRISGCFKDVDEGILNDCNWFDSSEQSLFQGRDTSYDHFCIALILGRSHL